jgi:hypothetical protein
MPDYLNKNAPLGTFLNTVTHGDMDDLEHLINNLQRFAKITEKLNIGEVLALFLAYRDQHYPIIAGLLIAADQDTCLCCQEKNPKCPVQGLIQGTKEQLLRVRAAEQQS